MFSEPPVIAVDVGSGSTLPKASVRKRRQSGSPAVFNKEQRALATRLSAATPGGASTACSEADVGRPHLNGGAGPLTKRSRSFLLRSGAAASAGDDDAVSRVQNDLQRLALLREERAAVAAERVAMVEAKLAAEKAVAEAEAAAKVAATASSESDLDRKTVKKMNPKALKAELKKRGLPIQGNKKVLQTRLLDNL